MNLKLNIGCGRDYRPGWLNIDISREVKADIYMDIRKEQLRYGGTVGYEGKKPHVRPVIIPDGSTILIWISGVLEQIGSNDELVHVMKECYRVLDAGGIMQVVVPNAKYSVAHRDPMDVRKFTPATFQYFKKGTQEFNDYGSVYGFPGWSEIVIDENERHILTITMKK